MVPTDFSNCLRMLSVEPNPDITATSPTGKSVASSSTLARFRRSRITHSRTLVPVAARNFRTRVRSLKCACAAIRPSVNGPPRFSRIHSSTGSISEVSLRRIESLMNCACPPERCGALTSSLLASFAAICPQSSARMCSARSVAAKMPPEVCTGGSSM